MCSPLSISTIPAIVLVSSRHSGAICTVLIVLQALRFCLRIVSPLGWRRGPEDVEQCSPEAKFAHPARDRILTLSETFPGP
jgi:hypothetical protein